MQAGGQAPQEVLPKQSSASVMSGPGPSPDAELSECGENVDMKVGADESEACVECARLRAACSAASMTAAALFADSISAIAEADTTALRG